MKKILLTLLLSCLMVACGEVGSIDDTADDSSVTMEFSTGPDPFSYTITPESASEPLLLYNLTRFHITSDSECNYTFNLILYISGQPWATLASDTGAVDYTIELDLPTGEYWIEADTECPWTIDISSLNESDSVDMNYYHCQGCCSSHGGTICLDGVTQCSDGSSLSETCLNKGCST